MKLTSDQKKLMSDAFEGNDPNLGDNWRELICTMRDEIRELGQKLAGMNIATQAYEAVLQQVPPYAEGAELEVVTAWIDKASTLFETLATIRLAMTAELEPKTARRKTQKESTSADPSPDPESE